MLIYIAIIIGILFFDIINNKTIKHRAFWVFISILAFISAVRYYVGTDYSVYKTIFLV